MRETVDIVEAPRVLTNLVMQMGQYFTSAPAAVNEKYTTLKSVIEQFQNTYHWSLRSWASDSDWPLSSVILLYTRFKIKLELPDFWDSVDVLKTAKLIWLPIGIWVFCLFCVSSILSLLLFVLRVVHMHI